MRLLGRMRGGWTRRPSYECVDLTLSLVCLLPKQCRVGSLRSFAGIDFKHAAKVLVHAMENPKILQDIRAGKLVAKKGCLQPGHRQVDSRPCYFVCCLLSVCDGPDRGPHRECRRARGKAGGASLRRDARGAARCAKLRSLPRPGISSGESEIAHEREANPGSYWGS